MMDAAVIKAQFGIIGKLNALVDAYALALALEQNQKWLKATHLQEYWRVIEPFGNEPPAFLVDSYERWKLRNANSF